MLYLFAPPPSPCMIAIWRVGGQKELLYLTFLGSPWFSASQGGRDPTKKSNKNCTSGWIGVAHPEMLDDSPDILGDGFGAWHLHQSHRCGSLTCNPGTLITLSEWIWDDHPSFWRESEWQIVFWLVVEPPVPKMMEFVSWDDDIPNIWKNKFHVANHHFVPLCSARWFSHRNQRIGCGHLPIAAPVTSPSP